jgi:hypothetical protein
MVPELVITSPKGVEVGEIVCTTRRTGAVVLSISPLAEQPRLATRKTSARHDDTTPARRKRRGAAAGRRPATRGAVRSRVRIVSSPGSAG